MLLPVSSLSSSPPGVDYIKQPFFELDTLIDAAINYGVEEVEETAVEDCENAEVSEREAMDSEGPTKEDNYGENDKEDVEDKDDFKNEGAAKTCAYLFMKVTRRSFISERRVNLNSFQSCGIVKLIEDADLIGSISVAQLYVYRCL
ncbi:hypothetical protein FNV43_RR05688 [Rhamnella rubrinervis]|uniref:Uncharacterized protein n=1 Tax=Rhamnella rubrinervis TaxID=2594499 RepID=A0A8K0MRV0_9ROSA|nr:hypothetical protein FNV43_RR05688 [Rhamnella rubrinervis]